MIYASTLEKWGQVDDVDLDIECGLYPPRFQLQICPKYLDSNCGNVDLCVRFEGICKISSGQELIVDHFLVAGKCYNRINIIIIIMVSISREPYTVRDFHSN